MDKQKEEGSEEGCCSSDKECGSGGCGSGGCGCGGGKRRCCTGKAALILVLMLISGIFGYGLGKCGKGRMGCMSPMANCPVTGAPAQAPVSK